MSQHSSPEGLLKALKYNFGHEQFREHQLDAIQATLAGRDTLLILPTGGGKSMTFQLPALAKGDCFTVVVGPLMALAKDQVDSCLDQGIDARVWNSDTSDEAKRSIQADLISDAPDMRLLYTTPESLRNPTLRSYLKEAYAANTLLSFAIDEAHCVSEWGQDFRPSYLQLAELKADFPNTPIAAMTASCTPLVEAGIIQLLKLSDPLVIKGGFNRHNIGYKVVYKELIGAGKQDDVVEHLVDFIKARQGQCGIIYARLRATCDWLGAALGACDLDVGVYHAGKDATLRRRVQQDWSSGGLDIVVATVAFGMGIDRADVRWVVHWDAPSSLEGYYQESGRAGRDGAPCEAVMYVSGDDIATIMRLEKGSRAGCAAAVAGFACQGGCRRRKIVDYFGQRRGPCGEVADEVPCDYCSQPAETRRLLQQWEQQLHSKSVAHTLRQQQQQQQDSDEEDEQQQQQEGGASPGRAGDAAAAAAVGGPAQAGSSRPRAGLWAPARAHGAASAAAAAAMPTPAQPCGRAVPAAAGSSCGLRGHVLTPVDANVRRPAAAALAAAAGGGGGVAGSSVAHGVLAPPSSHPGAGVAAAGGQPGLPVAVPQLRKRSLSSSQRQAAAGFKAPRVQAQPSSSPGPHGVQQEREQQQQQQPACSGGGPGPAAPPHAAADGSAAAAAAAAVPGGGGEGAAGGAASVPGLMGRAAPAGGLMRGRGGPGRQAFVPPFRR